MEKPLFEETQRNVALIIIPVMVSAIIGSLALVQIATGKPVGNHPISDSGIIIVFLITVIIGVLISSQKLKIIITKDEIIYSFGIFASRSTVKITDVQRMSITKYDPLTDFWGWGVKNNSTTDCYTVSGDTGLELILPNRNRKILIGTNKPTELQLVLQAHFPDKLKSANENKS